MNKIDRVMEITDRYLERFGKVLIGIYYLPPLAENWKFAVFINSLQVTLRRMDLMPGYTWFMDANEGHYFILWLNGYFRNDLSDVTPTVCRLWQIQSSLPLTVIDSIPLSADNQEYGKSRLRQFLYSPGLNQTVTANWHQRTFGTSRL
jgi:hypothetical protein